MIRRARMFAARNRSAAVLLVVLVVVAILSLAAFSFSEMMRTEYHAARVYGQQVQARMLADSGMEMIQMFLAQDEEVQRESGGHYDNPEMFQMQLVPSAQWLDPADARQHGRFSIIARTVDEGQFAGVRFGLEDESARLNLNTVLLADDQVENGGRTVLMALPGMTEEIADAILDWLDEDDELRQFGAEEAFYSGQEKPYAPKNGPLETVEELLLVRGVTPQMLFGNDLNHNGMIDGDEAGGAAIDGADNSDGQLDLGWAAYLTLHSMEANLQPDGAAKVDINQDDLKNLYEELSVALNETWATFIVAFRQNGPYNGSNSAATLRKGSLDFNRKGQYKFGNILDLIGPAVRVQFKGEDEATVLSTPFPEEVLAMNVYLPTLMDRVTVNPAPIIPGRISVNQAPRTVLLGVPGLDEQTVDQIINLREMEVTDERPQRRHETWLLTEAIVDLDTMKALMPFVTGGGRVYRAQIVGYFDSGGPAARIEAIIDATTSTPRIRFWRDLSHLGPGFALEQLGITAPE